MSDSSDERDRQIAALEAALKLPLPEASRRRLMADLRALRDQRAAGARGAVTPGAGDTHGTVNVGGNARPGVVVGVNLGRIIYGADPTDAQREQLTRYLRRLAAKLQRLPLRGLAARLDEGPGIALPQVYVMLATTNRVVVAEDSIALAGHLRPVKQFYQDGDPDKPLKQDYDPDYALPDRAIIAVTPPPGPLPAGGEGGRGWGSRRGREGGGRRLYRALLATEAAQQHRRLVLLGDPGGGKSTFLRHLAWALARRGLDELSADTSLFGWDDELRLLPVLLPLRKLAGRIAAEGAEPAAVSAALRDEMTREYDARQADEVLDRALEHSAALLLFDGLDEVPLEAVKGVTADRLTTLRAVRAFAELHSGARVVLTCRVRAFTEPLGACLGWPVETLAPFTLGQIRHFVADWYAALIERGSIARDLGEAQQQTLIAAIVGNERLRAMAGTPLLLTMMALVLYERGELPRDRSLLYERILEQLLGQWDQQKGGQSLTDVLGAPNLRSDDLRPILDKLSYQAHANATSQDGRGRLAAKDLRYALAEFLEQVRVGGAWEAAGRCLNYFNERSGLLLPEDDGQTYAFAHLTLQEHGAGRHMLLQPNAVALVMQRRADDRWREPIALGLGVVQKLYPMLADRIDRILTELIDPDEGGRPKPRERWYRDLVLAAELGQERDWDLLRALINVDRLQRELRRGLVKLLQDKTQPLPTAERVRAGFLLGDLGDPRVPVTIEEWQRELMKAQAGDASGYFCRVEAGTYTIGSADDDPDANEDEKPQHRVTFDAPFLIARYPITNAQWLTWVEQAGGQPSYFADDSDLNRPNQPVVGVTWHMCNDFCTWLSEHLGVSVRLPTEQEWEAAARGGDARRYPWGDDWQADRAATAEDQETRGARYTVPVGCYPAGAAPCGALDMAGNVWEWTASEWRSYPGAKKPFTEDAYRVLRGGYYGDNRNRVRCGARNRYHPDNFFNGNGFRVVVAPRLAQTF